MDCLGCGRPSEEIALMQDAKRTEKSHGLLKVIWKHFWIKSKGSLKHLCLLGPHWVHVNWFIINLNLFVIHFFGHFGVQVFLEVLNMGCRQGQSIPSRSSAEQFDVLNLPDSYRLRWAKKHGFQQWRAQNLQIQTWVFPKIGVPPNHPILRVFHYTPSILGYPYFWKHPHGLSGFDHFVSIFYNVLLELEMKMPHPQST